jgi:hypothetical protein
VKRFVIAGILFALLPAAQFEDPALVEVFNNY